MLDTLRDMLRRELFEPFRIMLASGDKYAVKNPGLVVMMRSQVFIAQPRSDRFRVLRLNQIAAIEAGQAAA